MVPRARAIVSASVRPGQRATRSSAGCGSRGELSGLPQVMPYVLLKRRAIGRQRIWALCQPGATWQGMKGQASQRARGKRAARTRPSPTRPCCFPSSTVREAEVERRQPQQGVAVQRQRQALEEGGSTHQSESPRGSWTQRTHGDVLFTSRSARAIWSFGRASATSSTFFHLIQSGS
jgi:hypothetical protein